MQWRSRPLALLLAVVLALQPLAAMSADSTPSSSWPPRAYRLDAVELRLQRLPGHGQPKQALVVAGGGSAALDSGRAPSRQLFKLQPDEVMALLQGLYRLRFFDLPTALGPRLSVFLLPDGTVGTQVARLMDVTTTTVCATLAGNEKCVRYTEGDGPPELEAWVEAAFVDAQRRTPPAEKGR